MRLFFALSLASAAIVAVVLWSPPHRARTDSGALSPGVLTAGALAGQWKERCNDCWLMQLGFQPRNDGELEVQIETWVDQPVDRGYRHYTYRGPILGLGHGSFGLVRAQTFSSATIRQQAEKRCSFVR